MLFKEELRIFEITGKKSREVLRCKEIVGLKT